MAHAPEVQPGDLLGLFDALESELRRHAERKIRTALRVSALLSAGYRPGEIRSRLNITPRDYTRAHEQLEQALRET